MNIHACVARHDLEGTRALLAQGADLEARDDQGRTPLMIAASTSRPGCELVRLLLEHGADPNATVVPPKPPEMDPEMREMLQAAGLDTSFLDPPTEPKPVDSVLAWAARNATAEAILLLLESGADARYADSHGYTIPLRIQYRQQPLAADEYRAVLSALRERGASLDAASCHDESPLTVASFQGRFGEVLELIRLGADPAPLAWNPLFFEIARGNLEAVRTLVQQGANLEARDGWGRTPFLLAVHAGQQAVARFLIQCGCDRSATTPTGISGLDFAIGNDDVHMLDWLLELGEDPERTDRFGSFPLLTAARNGAGDCLRHLLAAGADPHRRGPHGSAPMSDATSLEAILALHDAGLELGEVGSEMRLSLLGYSTDQAGDVSEEAFEAYHMRRFGRSNPERMNNALWDAQVRTRDTAYACAKRFGREGCESGREPVWCFQRFGQSLTRLPDGRFVEIGGEHEDYYDPDFCIYNDVVVHQGGGRFDLFGYPEAVFPPTDFHSATLVGSHIYVIGNLGYAHQRRPGETPVYRLNCEDWSFERLECQGTGPGWISRHRASLDERGRIQVQGGEIETGSGQELIDNTATFVLDLRTLRWT